jgi:hypothetical protein
MPVPDSHSESVGSETALIAISGCVVRGHGIASGHADDSPYPTGSLALQLPHFRARGFDLTHFYPATLNVQIDARGFVMRNPTHHFVDVTWFADTVTEDFSFSPCQLGFRDRRYDGWVYYPHPETKPANWKAPNIIEVITTWIDCITYGDALTLYIDPRQIDIVK